MPLRRARFTRCPAATRWLSFCAFIFVRTLGFRRRLLRAHWRTLLYRVCTAAALRLTFNALAARCALLPAVPRCVCATLPRCRAFLLPRRASPHAHFAHSFAPRRARAIHLHAYIHCSFAPLYALLRVAFVSLPRTHILRMATRYLCIFCTCRCLLRARARAHFVALYATLCLFVPYLPLPTSCVSFVTPFHFFCCCLPFVDFATFLLLCTHAYRTRAAAHDVLFRCCVRAHLRACGRATRIVRAPRAHVDRTRFFVRMRRGWVSRFAFRARCV